MEPSSRGATEMQQQEEWDIHLDLLGRQISETDWQKCEQWYKEQGHDWEQELGIENVWRRATPPCAICTKGARRRRAWTLTGEKRWTVDNKCCMSCERSEGRTHSTQCDLDNEENSRVMEMVGSMMQQAMGASPGQGSTTTELMDAVDQWMEGHNGYTDAMALKVEEIDGAKPDLMRCEMDVLRALQEEPPQRYPIRVAKQTDEWGFFIQRYQPNITDRTLELLMDEIMILEIQEPRVMSLDRSGTMEIRSRIKEAWSRIILRR